MKLKATKTEAKILDAIQAAKAKGLQIVDGSWGVYWNDDEQKFVTTNNCCCPLAAVLLASNDMPHNVCDLINGDDDHDKLTSAASGFLGKESGWCEKFTEVFDVPDIGSTTANADRAALKVREVLFDENYGITK